MCIDVWTTMCGNLLATICIFHVCVAVFLFSVDILV